MYMYVFIISIYLHLCSRGPPKSVAYSRARWEGIYLYICIYVNRCVCIYIFINTYSYIFMYLIYLSVYIDAVVGLLRVNPIPPFSLSTTALYIVGYRELFSEELGGLALTYAAVVPYFINIVSEMFVQVYIYIDI